MRPYQLKILNPRRLSSNPQDLILSNQLYQTWTKVFSKLVADAGGKLDPDDYFRNDFALVLYDQGQIVGFSLCTEFNLNLDAVRDHHYWKCMQPATLAKLQSGSLHTLMSMEYLTVLPDWRNNKPLQISWAEVLVAVGLLYQDIFPMDAMVGTPRADIRMSAMCESLGGVPAQEPILKMNYPCSVHIFKKEEQGLRRFSNPLTQKWAHTLWNEREDLRINENLEQPYKKAV